MSLEKYILIQISYKKKTKLLTTFCKIMVNYAEKTTAGSSMKVGLWE